MSLKAHCSVALGCLRVSKNGVSASKYHLDSISESFITKNIKQVSGLDYCLKFIPSTIICSSLRLCFNHHFILHDKSARRDDQRKFPIRQLWSNRIFLFPNCVQIVCTLLFGERVLSSPDCNFVGRTWYQNWPTHYGSNSCGSTRLRASRFSCMYCWNSIEKSFQA